MASAWARGKRTEQKKGLTLRFLGRGIELSRVNISGISSQAIGLFTLQGRGRFQQLECSMGGT